MTEAFQLYELVLAVLLIISLVPVLLQYRRYRCKWLLGTYVAFTAASIATVAESFVFGTILNMVEHLAYMTAGILFLLTAERSANAVTQATIRDVLKEVL